MMRKHGVSIGTWIGAPLLAAVVVLAAGCETIRDAVEAVRKPEVRIVSTELDALTFTGMTLLFEVEVRNPNPIGIGLSGFDYELEIEGNSFVSGQVQDRVTIAAIRVPR